MGNPVTSATGDRLREAAGVIRDQKLPPSLHSLASAVAYVTETSAEYKAARAAVLAAIATVSPKPYVWMSEWEGEETRSDDARVAVLESAATLADAEEAAA